jgi:hypothetical protein
LPGFQKQRYNPANANAETTLEKISSRRDPQPHAIFRVKRNQTNPPN